MQFFAPLGAPTASEGAPTSQSARAGASYQPPWRFGGVPGPAGLSSRPVSRPFCSIAELLLQHVLASRFADNVLQTELV